MPSTQKSDTPYAAQDTVGMPACPRCDGDLLRIWRRPVDRMTSWVAPVRRYRCQAFCCQWEGNLRSRQEPGLGSRGGHGGDGDSVLPTSFVVSMILSVAGVGFILVATGTNWLEPTGSVEYTSADNAWRMAAPAPTGGAQVARAANP